MENSVVNLKVGEEKKKQQSEEWDVERGTS